MPANPDDPTVGADKPEAEKISPTPEGVMNLPAIYVDSYWVQTWTNRVRITFGEAFVGTVRYRAAVTMATNDAENLVRFLTEMIEKEKKKTKT